MKNWINKNKVFLSAFISTLVLVLQQALSSGQTSWKAIGFAALIAVIGMVANQWKGKGLTITGIISTLAGVFHTIWTTGSFTWNEFLLSSALALLLAVSGSLQPEPAPRSSRS